MMVTAVRQRAIVGEGGKVEIISSDLPAGALVDVIVVVESDAKDTTEYLLSNAANRRHLLKAIKDMDDRQKYVHVDADDL
jgi:antitoxin YefM